MGVVASTVAAAAPGARFIELRRVSKTFESGDGSRTEALQALDLEVREREFVSILGPSGCGKSTLLRIIAGLMSFDGEDVVVDGESVSRPRQDVGVVFQTANLLPWRNVAANLALGVEIRGESLDSARLAAMVEMLGLTGFESRYPHELSGGMKQRVALGQALVRDPKLLLLDEPFGALDALTRDKLNIELLRIWQAEQKTVVLVTHSITEAVLLSDRVLVLSGRPGKVIEDVGIDLPRPREPRTTRQSPEFSRLVGYLGELMGVV